MFFVLLVHGLALCGGQRSTLQGDRPSCDRCDLAFRCNCSSAGLTHVPMVTEQALSLDLSFNAIAVVTAEDLRGHRRLKVLSLHGEAQQVTAAQPIRRADPPPPPGNRLVLIQPSAFEPLWDLEDLDLSNNQLAALDHRWFRNLEALRVLNLLHNPYR